MKYSYFLVSRVESAPAQGHQGERSKPHCKECHQPMKGHKFVVDCPRNKRTVNNDFLKLYKKLCINHLAKKKYVCFLFRPVKSLG